LPVTQDAVSIRVQNKAYAWRSSLQPKLMNFGVIVTAASQALLITALDNIKTKLNTREDAALILDILSTRYWNARFDSLTGGFVSPVAWRGSLSFTALDPLAYSTSETSSPFNIDADPDTVVETAGGTANVEPVYTLTAGEALGAIELTLENLTTGISLTWSGTVADEDELIIDCAAGTIYLNDTPSMATMEGRFPWLIPGANSIKVTNWSNSGTLDIVYRARYL
jgi:phage-related protein